MMKNYILTMLCFLLLACNSDRSENLQDCYKKTNLKLQFTNDSSLSASSYIDILYTSRAIYMHYCAYSGKNELYQSMGNEFYLFRGAYYLEKRFYSSTQDKIESVYLKALSKEDTSYTYEYCCYENVPLLPEGSEDWHLKVKGEQNRYNLEITSMIDTSYRFVFSYDSLYNIDSIWEYRFGLFYYYW